MTQRMQSQMFEAGNCYLKKPIYTLPEFGDPHDRPQPPLSL
jgi:hypothetical protein